VSVSAKDRVSFETVELVLSQLREAGREGVVVEDLVKTLDLQEYFEALLALLVDSKFVVSQVVRKERRYYHVSYY
jgi:hypothetical protein